MYRKQDSLEQGLVTPPSPTFTSTNRRKTFSNNFRPELEHHHHQHYPSSYPHSFHDGRGANYSSPPPPHRLPGDNGGGCLARTPFASLCAFLCCLFGVLLFGTMMAWAFTASVEQARRALHVNHLPWLDKVYLLFLVSACAMVAVSLAFMLIGMLSTGPTRHAVFNTTTTSDGCRPVVDDEPNPATAAARRGGRISCVVAICLSIVLNLVWTTISIFTALLCFFYTILFLLCSLASDCLDFGVFGPLLNKQNNSLKFCAGELQQFCAVTNTVIVWYFVGLLGSIIVCVGLVQFIASNAANYAHIGSEAKYAELRHLFYSEISSSGSNMPLEQFSIVRRQNNNNSGKQDERSHRQQQQQLQRQQTENNMNSAIAAKRRNSQNTSRRWEYGRNEVKSSPPSYEYQRNPKSEKRAEKRSVGAMVGSVRRNSYQSSLHGSNNWLNYVAADMDTMSPVADKHYDDLPQQHQQQHYAIGKIVY